MAMISVSIDDSLNEKLLEVCKRNDRSRSAEVRRCIKKSLDSSELSESMTPDDMGEALLGEEWEKIKARMDAKGLSAEAAMGEFFAEYWEALTAIKEEPAEKIGSRKAALEKLFGEKSAASLMKKKEELGISWDDMTEDMGLAVIGRVE